MGNLQTNETKHKQTGKSGGGGGTSGGKVKSLMKIRGKRGKIDTNEFTGVVPSIQNENHTISVGEHALDRQSKEIQNNITKSNDSNRIDEKQIKNENDNSLLITDSWCKVNKIDNDKKTPPSTSGSTSESNFTDPLLTPVGSCFNTEINQCYLSEESVNLDVEVPNTIQDDFLLNLTLNSFKLNDYRARHEEDRDKKLSKLGLSKTSQISLEADPRDSFVSDNVEIVNQLDDDYGRCDDDVSLKRKSQDLSGDDGQKVAHLVKRMSDISLTNGNPEYKRHMSVPTDLIKSQNSDSLVLKKVASLTLNKAELEAKITKPKFVPEKLDFQLYEKFEGHMLVNWYLSEFGEEHHLVQSVTNQELKLLAIQFCTHLLAAGVLRQIPDKDVPMYNIFKPDCMYYWTHAETPLSIPQTPGKLSMISWPPMSPSEVFLSPSANEISPRTPPIDQSDENLLNQTRNKEFKNSARDVEILALEDEIKRLRQENEKYKTVIEIQALTANAMKDFSSPIDNEERKLLIDKNCDNSSSSLNKLVQTDNNLIHSDLVFDRKNSETQTQSKSDSLTQTNEAQTEPQLIDNSTNTDPILIDSTTLDITRTQNNLRDIEVNWEEIEAAKSFAPYSKPSSSISQITESIPLSESVKNASLPSLGPSLTASAPETSASPISPKLGKTEHPTPPTIPGKTSQFPPPPPPLMPGIDTFQLHPPPPPPMPGIGAPFPETAGLSVPPPPPMPGISGLTPLPPPMPGMAGPPPPPLPGTIGPPPPPMPGITVSGLGGSVPPPPPPPGSFTLDGKPAGPPPPPPPLGGPVPLPAPPAGGWSQQKAVSPPVPVCLGLRKSTLNPTVPMKPLYWTRIIAPQIDVGIENSTESKALWNQIDELPLESLNEFTDLFSRQVVNRKPTIKKLETKAKVEAVKLLDSKRSQNVGILAQSLHIDFQEIENAIYNFDTSIVSLEALQQIYEVRATPEELSLINNHLQTKPEIPLDKPEQFLHELSEISNFAERISCLMFQVEFDDSISTIGNTLTNIKTTCEYLVSSTELKEVMAIILTLGNYMNGGNMTRGQADGFGLEILGKLKDVKSKDSKITLLHFIVRIYMKKIENPFEPNISLPVPEPGDIRRAASVNFDEVKIDLQKLQKQLDECEKRMAKVIESSTPDNLQPFKDKMISFIENSKKQLRTEFENLDECQIKFINTMKFYLFKPKSGSLETYPPNSFFEMWLSFCVDFKDIFKKELIRLEKEKIQEIKKKENLRLSETVKIKERENGLKSKIKRIQSKQASSQSETL